MHAFLHSYGTAAAIAAVVFTGVALAAANTETRQPQNHVVEIRDLEFVPPELVVAPGDTITWANHDFVPHTATAEGDGWASTTLKTGESWQITVQAGMASDYFCSHHPSMTARLRIANSGG